MAGAVNVKVLALLPARVNLPFAHRNLVRVDKILRVDVVLSVGLYLGVCRVVTRRLGLVWIVLFLINLETPDVSVVILPPFLVALVRRAFVGSVTIGRARVFRLAVVLVLKICVVISPNFISTFRWTHKTFFEDPS